MSRRRWSRRRQQAFLERLFTGVLDYVTGLTAFTWRGNVIGNGESAELHVFECVTELVGGSEDGAEVIQGFSVALADLVDFLSLPEEGGAVPPLFGFNCTVGATDEVDLLAGPHVYVDGWFRGVSVVVYIHSRPPGDEKASWLCYQDGRMKPKEVSDE